MSEFMAELIVEGLMREIDKAVENGKDSIVFSMDSFAKIGVSPDSLDTVVETLEARGYKASVDGEFLAVLL